MTRIINSSGALQELDGFVRRGGETFVNVDENWLTPISRNYSWEWNKGHLVELDIALTNNGAFRLSFDALGGARFTCAGWTPGATVNPNMGALNLNMSASNGIKRIKGLFQQDGAGVTRGMISFMNDREYLVFKLTAPDSSHFTLQAEQNSTASHVRMVAKRY
jgi:hypothetical protein